MNIMNNDLDDMNLHWEKTLLNYLKPRCKNSIVWSNDK